MQTAKQKLKRAAPWLFLLLVLAGLAAVRGLAANYEIGYEIMNGDFQNYNPVRHLLAGQVPYRDFTVYLGAGELYSVGGLLLVLGNSFGRSMFATNFCTWFYFELLVLAVCLVVIGTARAARVAALALCSVFFAYVQGANLPFAGQVNTLLSYAAANGNSARMMRSAALTLAVLVILLGLHFWQQDTSRRLLAPAVLVPFAAGFFVPWSNDMGGAAYISIALGYGLYLIRLYRSSIGKIVVQTLRYIVTSVVGLGVSVLLISWGHPLAWLRQTRGTSAYQTWYYGNTLSDRVCSVADLHWPGAGSVLPCGGTGVCHRYFCLPQQTLCCVGGRGLCPDTGHGAVEPAVRHGQCLQQWGPRAVRRHWLPYWPRRVSSKRCCWFAKR